MTINLTVERAHTLLKEIVAEKGPDFVYKRPEGEMCAYLEDLEDGGVVPSCLFGHLFLRAGVSAGDIAPHEGCGVVALFRFLTDAEENALIVRASAEAQASQDTGQPWGRALAQWEQTLDLPITYHSMLTA